MKATITFDITPEEVTAILDKLREHRKEDEREWEEKHPPIPMPPFMTENPVTTESVPLGGKKKDKPN